jgi:hypothetical protein
MGDEAHEGDKDEGMRVRRKKCKIESDVLAKLKG